MSEKNANNVDQIRDLIFGSQIKEFEDKFNQLNKMLQSVEEKITKAFNESYDKLQKETERSLEALEKKIDNLASSTQKERSKLKELIDTTDDTLHDQLNNQKDEFATKLKIMKENAVDENRKMLENMQTMKVEIQTAVETGLSSLSDDKLSRDSMAQMLLDVAMKIQGTDMTALLVEGKTSEK
jgi:DNA repair exonuclease SbcCD ATPase subunit